MVTLISYEAGCTAACDVFGVKTAARRILQLARQAATQGNNALATRLQGISRSIAAAGKGTGVQGTRFDPGSFDHAIGAGRGQPWGGGAEGSPVKMLHPKYGPNVSKFYDTEKGFLTPAGVQQKAIMWDKAFKGHPDVAQFLGATTVPGRPPIHHFEHIEGMTGHQLTDASLISDESRRHWNEAKQRVSSAANNAGYSIYDTDNTDNWIRNPQGQWKLVDFVPGGRAGSGANQSLVRGFVPGARPREAFVDQIRPTLDAGEEAADAARLKAQQHAPARTPATQRTVPW